jgi:hypothetical protein
MQQCLAFEDLLCIRRGYKKGFGCMKARPSKRVRHRNNLSLRGIVRFEDCQLYWYNDWHDVVTCVGVLMPVGYAGLNIPDRDLVCI